jgi:hypothetical protein
MTRNQTLGFEEAGLALHLRTSARAAICPGHCIHTGIAAIMRERKFKHVSFAGARTLGRQYLDGLRGRIARRQRQCQEMQSSANIPRKNR